MRRPDWVLVVVIAAELAVGGFLFVRNRLVPTPPVPDLSIVDARVASHVRESAASCRTPDDWAGLGTTYIAYGYFPEAEACARHAAGHQPADAVRAYEWAFALERIGRLEDANVQYERAVGLGHPQAKECWYHIGRNWLRLERADEARSAFERAGALAGARYELARLSFHLGDEAGAATLADQLATDFPTAVQPHLLRHKIDVLRDRPTAAVAGDRAYRFQTNLWTPFIRDVQRLEDAHLAVGLAHEKKEAERLLASGRWATAEPRLRAAFAERWDPEMADLVAEVEFSRGDPAAAERVLREAIDRAGATPHLLYRLADALERSGQPDQAEAAWLRATALGTGAAVKNSYHRLALLYQKARKADAARAAEARAYAGAGHEFVVTGRPGEAKTLLEQALQADSKLPAAWFYLGEANRLLGQTAAARAAYQKCLDLEPTHGRARRGLLLLDPG
jgi:tetratricopeptide (TPR) repeat protein